MDRLWSLGREGQAAQLMVCEQLQQGERWKNHQDCRAFCHHQPARTSGGHREELRSGHTKTLRTRASKRTGSSRVQNGGSDWGKARPAADLWGQNGLELEQRMEQQAGLEQSTRGVPPPGYSRWRPSTITTTRGQSEKEASERRRLGQETAEERKEGRKWEGDG